MLNYVAIYVVAYVISGPLRGGHVTFARTDTIGTPRCRSSSVATATSASCWSRSSVPIAWWLLFREHARLRDPRRWARIRMPRATPGMRPRSLIVLTMALCGLLAGLAGAIEILGASPLHAGQLSRRTSASTRITVALLGRAHPVGILFAGLLFGAMHAGAGLMQIQAGDPGRRWSTSSRR